MPWLVALGLLVAWAIGQAERFQRHHRAELAAGGRTIGHVAPVVFGVCVAGVLVVFVLAWRWLHPGRVAKPARAPRVVRVAWLDPDAPLLEVAPGIVTGPYAKGEEYAGNGAGNGRGGAAYDSFLEGGEEEKGAE